MTFYNRKWMVPAVDVLNAVKVERIFIPLIDRDSLNFNFNNNNNNNNNNKKRIIATTETVKLPFNPKKVKNSKDLCQSFDRCQWLCLYLCLWLCLLLDLRLSNNENKNHLKTKCYTLERRKKKRKLNSISRNKSIIITKEKKIHFNIFNPQMWFDP